MEDWKDLVKEWKILMKDLGEIFDEFAGKCSEQIEFMEELRAKISESPPGEEFKEKLGKRLRELQERVKDTREGLEGFEDEFYDLSEKLAGVLDRLYELNERLEELQEMLE
jgi:predicted nuclease with TOPRIM domain